MLSRRILLIIALTLSCFGLTLHVFYPGVMTYDARYVYEDIAKGFLGDWQSPVMTVLWSLIDPIAPGSGSMFLLIVTLYWLAFGVLALTIAGRSIWLALVLLLLAVSPPAFVFLGIIWRDVLLACTWLLSAALSFAFADRGIKMRMPIQVLALGLLVLGVLLRPNALLAAPVLGVYIAWPKQFSWKRAAIIFVPAVVGLFALVQVVYYGVLGATRQNLVQSIMVFDLGGISHFAKQNQFPISWTVSESALLTTSCYQPTEWDIYRTPPCDFVMERLYREKLFGSPAIPDAWRGAIIGHPVAYLQHRAALMWNFLIAENFTMWTQDLDDPTKTAFADRPAFTALRKMHDALKWTPLFRAGSWLLICITACVFAWGRRSNTSAGAFAIGVCGSAAVYVLTFFAVGVGSDFRYVYWAVLASITGAVTVALRPGRESSGPSVTRP